MGTRNLQLGKTYYRVTYSDRHLTMLGIEPMVYIGDVEDEDGTLRHAFQDPTSYVRYGSRLAPGGADHDDLRVFLNAPSEVGRDIVDLPEVVAQAKQALSRAETLGWPSLPVLVGGGQQAT